MREPIDPELARWLVEHRGQVQELLLKLYEFQDALPSHGSPRAPQVEAFYLLVGAGFSLWRAVFLVGGEHQWAAIPDTAKLFLSTVLADNAINYPQDKAMSAWTFGYYLNNGYFRVARAFCLLSGVEHENDLRSTALFPPAEPGEVQPDAESLDAFLEQWKHGIVGDSSRRKWETCYRATVAGLRLLKQSLGHEPAL